MNGEAAGAAAKTWPPTVQRPRRSRPVR